MVEVSDLHKQFSTERGAVHALGGVSFQVPEGSLLTLLGPSGCGKSTTLRCIAGLEQPERGMISFSGQVVFSSETRQFEPPENRSVGMVFQSYAIWPHMTVFENVAYPLQGRGWKKALIAQEVKRVLSLVGLAEFSDRPSPHLSGGEQQRVALARALVANPKVLLLDEPLSNLDAKLRQHMRVEIRKLQRQSRVTAIYVTHDQEEAMVVSDEILFMSKGEIVERGRPEEIYTRPRRRLTAQFFGEANFLKGEIKGKEQNSLIVETSGGLVACKGNQLAALGEQVSVFFRPEDVEALRERPKNGFFLTGLISETVFLGKLVECLVEVSNKNHVNVSVHRKFDPKKGEEVYLVIDPDACSIIND